MKRLPLVELVLEQFSGVSLEKVLIIGSQHILPTTLTMFQHLFKLGLKPSNVRLIGKCYSTNPEVFYKMQETGIDVCRSSLEFDSHIPFDQKFSHSITKFLLSRLLQTNLDDYEKIILMDDGGQLISIAHQLIDKPEKIVGIEQTSAGYRRLSKQSLKFPVINVAQSKTKLSQESPIIAKICLEKICSQLDALQLHPKKVLIIGNGPIGHEILKATENQFEVYTYDIQQNISDISLASFEASLKNFDMIIGCTGTTSLFPHQMKNLKQDAILVSASSSDREFSSIYLRKNISKHISCHQTVYANNIYLLNCGFPINFDYDYATVDGKEFQLTRSLLTTAILQGFTQETASGLINLDSKIQNTILGNLDNIYHQSSESDKKARVKKAV